MVKIVDDKGKIVAERDSARGGAWRMRGLVPGAPRHIKPHGVPPLKLKIRTIRFSSPILGIQKMRSFFGPMTRHGLLLPMCKDHAQIGIQ